MPTTPPPETLAAAVVGALVAAVAAVAVAVATGAVVVAVRVVGAALVVANGDVGVFDVVVAGARTQTNRLFTFAHRSEAPCTTAVLFAPMHTPPAFAGFAAATFGFGAALATFDPSHPMTAKAVAASKVRVTVRFVIWPSSSRVMNIVWPILCARSGFSGTSQVAYTGIS
jgi:hypothetical protein